MYFRLYEAGIIEELLQLLRRIGRHSLHHVCPHGIRIDNFYHDSKPTTRLQNSAHLFQTFGQVRPKIDGFHSRQKVELRVFVWQFCRRSLLYKDLLFEQSPIHFAGFGYTLVRDVDAIDFGFFAPFE